jgi:hypothetical protein
MRHLNPWWTGRALASPPPFRRDAFDLLLNTLESPRAARPTLLTGLPGVGRTTLLNQLATALIDRGAPPERLVYASFDHPLLASFGPEAAVRVWRESAPPGDGRTMLLLDDLDAAPGGLAWLRSSAFPGDTRVVATAGGAPPGLTPDGPVAALELGPLSFREYLGAVDAPNTGLPEAYNLRDLFGAPPEHLEQLRRAAEPLVPHFRQYLLRGGLPGAALLGELDATAAVLCQSTIGPALRANLGGRQGVRRLPELESLLLYIALHEGATLDLQGVSEKLGISKNTLRAHLDLLEAAHLIHRIAPMGYGTRLQRGRMKVFAADSGLARALLVRGSDALADEARARAAVEGCVYRHLRQRYAAGGPAFSYWRDKSGDQVNLIATIGRSASRPFHVHYADDAAHPAALKGLRRFCVAERVQMAYVVSRRLEDFGPLALESPGRGDRSMLETQCMMVPAVLFCHWFS